MTELPYCGTAPVPGELLMRFNLDPPLITALLVLTGMQVWAARGLATGRQLSGLTGWVIASAAFVSPLCALSVALFAGRIAQHMILVLVAAPLIAAGLPARAPRAVWPLWSSALVFFIALWFWHMPSPYDATFHSVAVYWCMHLSLFGSAIGFWYTLMHQPRAHVVQGLAAATLTSIQMGLLGAFLSLADHALFRWHFATTWAWHLTPLEDQQLGGVLMWVPGISIFLWVAVRSLARLWATLEGVRAA
ncbi:MAG TPA: cytochrome c oxidase assembly protein [Steroidobacteraceae bacterium]